MNRLRQMAAIAAMNLGSMSRRWGAALVAVIGVGSAVAVMVALLGVASGVRNLAHDQIAADRAIVLSNGAAAEDLGAFTRDQVAAVGEAPGVARDHAGRPDVLPLVVSTLQATKKTDGSAIEIAVRGLNPEVWDRLRPTRIVQGRLYRSGQRELVVGRAVRTRFRHFELGDRIRLQAAEWTVVGIAESAGGFDESGVFTDDLSLQSVLNRPTYQSLLVRLTGPEALPDFARAIAADRRLDARAQSYRDFVQAQTRQLTSLLRFLGLFIGAVMGIGAAFTAVNALYAMIEARRREIATLRAIGFETGPIFGAILAEAVLLCALAGLAGGAAAALLVGGQEASAYDLSFAVQITPPLLGVAVAWASLIGLIGGLAPAIAAARIPVTSALRAF
ncbi:ABC transporter permease [Phenylobacterium sp.]|uniref:ABC transporter permease n=1 Tax=Phenylobacterium sp. TaxID=1871053 RepID=UPI003BA9B8D3